MKPISFLEFSKQYPDDNAVLQDVFSLVYGDLKACPGCERETKWHRVKMRKCYACQHCGHQLYPLAQTPMKDTKLPLVAWYYAIFLFSVSKNGVSSKELQRQLGVSYPTAHRIHKKLRGLMVDQDMVLDGTVEMDETLVGGRKRGGKRGWGADKPCVFGMVERGGDIVTRVVPDRKATTLFPIITQHTTEEVVAHTDDFSGYNKLHKEVAGHHVIQHSKKEYVCGDVHTQTIDGHWSIIKRSIRGTYTSVSRKYLQTYLDEFSFRRNHRTECLFTVMRRRMGRAA
jgi:transposase